MVKSTKRVQTILFLMLAFLCFTSCEKGKKVGDDEDTHGNVTVENGESGEYSGMYVLNQGLQGTNKAQLDYINFKEGKLYRDIYTENNMGTDALGDIGNDLKQYGARLYAVLNGSNKIEVMNLATAKRLGQIDIANARNICFSGSKAYVSSYVALSASGNGEVVEIDTATLQITRRVEVGRQPEELLVHEGKLFVANSGGLNTPSYERTISVISLETLKEEYTIDVAINLELIRKDQYDQIWVTSRGDYNDVPPSLYCLAKNSTTNKYEVKKNMELPCSKFDIRNDSLFYYYSKYIPKADPENTYGVVDIKKHEILTKQLLAGKDVETIKIPYNIVVAPKGGQIYICDVVSYTGSGSVVSFTGRGSKSWTRQLGALPSNIVLVKK